MARIVLRSQGKCPGHRKSGVQRPRRHAEPRPKPEGFDPKYSAHQHENGSLQKNEITWIISPPLCSGKRVSLQILSFGLNAGEHQGELTHFPSPSPPTTEGGCCSPDKGWVKQQHIWNDSLTQTQVTQPVKILQMPFEDSVCDSPHRGHT